VLLIENGIRVEAVVTRPDKRRGRGSETSPSPVKATAVRFNIPCFDTIDAVLAHLHHQESLVGVTGVVVAYGRILKDPLISLIPLVNLHFSLLPRWRGAAPVERAILSGDATTGSSIMQIEEGLDTGGVYAVEEVDILSHESADELRSRLGVVGARQLVQLLRNGFPQPARQNGEPIHAEKISPAELQIHWSQPAINAQRQVRVGGAFTYFRNSRVKVLDARVHNNDDENTGGTSFATGAIVQLRKEGVVVQTANGQLLVSQVQAESKKPMLARDWANGLRVAIGDHLEFVTSSPNKDVS
jgi:methionyl-tRNA formyltransferase